MPPPSAGNAVDELLAISGELEDADLYDDGTDIIDMSSVELPPARPAAISVDIDAVVEPIEPEPASIAAALVEEVEEIEEVEELEPDYLDSEELSAASVRMSTLDEEIEEEPASLLSEISEVTEDDEIEDERQSLLSEELEPYAAGVADAAALLSQQLQDELKTKQALEELEQENASLLAREAEDETTHKLRVDQVVQERAQTASLADELAPSLARLPSNPDLRPSLADDLEPDGGGEGVDPLAGVRAPRLPSGGLAGSIDWKDEPDVDRVKRSVPPSISPRAPGLRTPRPPRASSRAPEPSEAAAPAGEASKAPQAKASKASGKASKAPGKASKASGKASKASGKASKAPGKASKAPGKASKAPGKASKAPTARRRSSRAPMPTDPPFGLPPEEPPARAVPTDAPRAAIDLEAIKQGDQLMGVSLADVQGLEDLPEEAHTALVDNASVESLNMDEELNAFAVALVLQGKISIMPAVADAVCAEVAAGQVVFTQGHLAEGVALRAVASVDGTVIAYWKPADLEAQIADCPWVEDDLRTIADRYQALAGAAMGSLGERLDDSLRAMVTDRCEVIALSGEETLLEQGATVNGMYVVGAGHVELLDDGQVKDTLYPGDFLFPAQVMASGGAPQTVRASSGGALLLRSERMAAHELLVSVPPLLEILAG